MDPVLNEIKQLRRKCGLTQTQLAKQANVSQSLIAKIEAGRIDPTYSKARKILDTLHSLNMKHEKKAEDLMCTKLVKITTNENVAATVKKMKEFGISQVPVYKDKQIVGLITENVILNGIADGKKDITQLAVSDLMDEVPPMIPRDTPFGVVANLLTVFPIVFVATQGNIEGLISKADLLSEL